jgi:endonuclease/exonuclease/phosphatase family metal-dependent hydrolase
MKPAFSLTFLLLSVYVLFSGCDPLVTQFSGQEPAIKYTASTVTTASGADTLVVMTWNIRFGAARSKWYGDSCGDRVILPESEVIQNLEAIALKIAEVDPDVVLLQEADVESKRTAYIDEVQWLLDHTALNYGVFASMWQAQVVLADGLGRINTGNAILSKWPLRDAQRIQLPLRGDQDSLTRYFYLRRNILKARLDLPPGAGTNGGDTPVYIVDIHATAFATDDTKKKHIARFKEVLEEIQSEGGYFVAGGDLNAIPPTSDSTDYCIEDGCGESYHAPGDDPQHREGSYFTPEITWLQPIYDAFTPDIDLSTYTSNQQDYFTHSTSGDRFWDRKLDYLWTNCDWGWVPGSVTTHQEAMNLSDHAPVSARWVIP